jgi:hypothetical protein
METISSIDLAHVVGGEGESEGGGATAGAQNNWWGDGPRPTVDTKALTSGPELGPYIPPGQKYVENDHGGKTGVQQAVENVDRIMGGYKRLNDAGKNAVELRRMMTRGR